jgi:phosphoglycolate phosphatase-like HAD superfamily hydrolase
MLLRLREDRRLQSEGIKVTKNVKGLLEALRQSINEAILESNEVAAAMAALKRTGKCPVFSIDVVLQEAPQAQVVEALGRGEELVLGDADVDFLAAIGITDPSWCTPQP